MKSATGPSFLFYIILKRVLLFLSCCFFFYFYESDLQNQVNNFSPKATVSIEMCLFSWIWLKRRMKTAPLRQAATSKKRSFWTSLPTWSMGRRRLPSKLLVRIFFLSNQRCYVWKGFGVWQFFFTLTLSLSRDGNDKSTEKSPLL